MKKLTSLLLCPVLTFSMAVGAFADGLKITVDGKDVNQVNVNGDSVPAIEQQDFDNPVVPLRAVLNAMGYYVDYLDGEILGGIKADPITFDDSNSFVSDGTTFVPYGILGSENGINYSSEYKDGTVSYTSNYVEMQEGYYTLKLGDKFLTGETLPESDLVEKVINEETGEETEKVTSRQNQIRARGVSLQDKSENEDTQLWLVKKIADKKYAIINKHNSLAMDVNSWSMENGASIIQYTLAAGTNQQWMFLPDYSDKHNFRIFSVHSKLPIGSGDGEALTQGTDFDNQMFTLELITPYTNPVIAAVETEAFNELDKNYQRAYTNYFFTDVDFSQSANSKAEAFLRENNFADADKETQKSLIRSCLDITYSDLLGGWMRDKKTADYEIVSITRTADTNPEVLENPDAKNYYIYTIAMECTSPEDIHTFTVETVDENDEEHVRKVCEAVACFEPPVRKTLRHFYYTGDKFGTWNAWDGEVWNNTGSKFDVDGMLTMFSHELGHVIDSDFKVGDDVWRRAINSDVIPTSGYGKTNRWEDFGEFSRLYLMSRGDEERMAAIEAIYPNRTATYRAALYNIDNDYYKEYKALYDALTAPIGDTSVIDGEMYYTIASPSGKLLTNTDAGLSFSDPSDSDACLWQLSVEDEQGIKIFSKADGTSLTVASAEFNAAVACDSNNATFIGIMPGESENGRFDATLTVSETGFTLTDDPALTLIASSEEAAKFTFTPVEKISGFGLFTIKSGDKYLIPESENRGARLVLSDDTALSSWYITKLPNNVGCITNPALDNFAVDISGASEEPGAAALAYTLSRNANQMWEIIENQDGTYSFKAQHSGLYLAVDDEGKAIQSSEKFSWTMEEVK